MKNHYLLILLFVTGVLSFGCKDTIVIPPPTLELANDTLNLNDLTSSTSFSMGTSKMGQGTITYKIVSDKKWLLLNKPDTTTYTISDSIRIRTDIYADDILEGKNEATLTITPNINGVLATPVNIKVFGNYKKTKIITNETTFDLGTIKSATNRVFILQKIGLEKASYKISSDQPWLTFETKSGWKNNTDSVVVKIDPTSLTSGAINGNITVTPLINDKPESTFILNFKGFFDDTKTGIINGHTLTKNEVWAGNITLTGSIIVPKEFSLTIKPGSKIVVKKLTQPINIQVFGGIFLDGNQKEIIEIKSEQSNPSNKDWAGFKVSGNLEMSFVHIKDAANGLNFEDRSFANNQSKSYVINNVLFNHNLIGIYDLRSDSEIILNNLSFKNIQIFCVSLGNSSRNIKIQRSEFLDNSAYIHVHVPVSNARLSIFNSNFAAKNGSSLSNLEIINGNKNNQITSDFTFGLTEITGFGTNQNTYIATNQRFAENLNIGCGFSNLQ